MKILGHKAKEKPPLTIVGDVGGKIAIMVVSIDEKMVLGRLETKKTRFFSFLLQKSKS
jgi:hypothetical protein